MARGGRRSGEGVAISMSAHGSRGSPRACVLSPKRTEREQEERLDVEDVEQSKRKGRLRERDESFSRLSSRHSVEVSMQEVQKI
jgi:hypothetical protein